MKFVQGGPARYQHQRRGLRKLVEHQGSAALLFDPGLGKSAVVIDYAGILALKLPEEEARVLVVCPLAAVDTWVLQAQLFGSPQVSWWAEALGGGLKAKAEALSARGRSPMELGAAKPRGEHAKPEARHVGRALAHWARTLDAGVQPSRLGGPSALRGPRVVLEVLNIDALSSRRPYAPRKTMADVMLEAVKRFAPHLVVVDESHRIKSNGGNASKLLGRIAEHAPRRVILTGTVMPHGPLDVYGQWRFLDPTAFGDQLPDGSRRRMTWGGFRDRFAVMGGYMGREVIGYRHLDDMHTIMAERAEVARKADALDLPPTTDTIVPVNLGPAEHDAYRQMKASLAARLADGSLSSSPNRLAQLMRLRQITSGHLPDDTGAMHELGRSKAKTIASLVHDTLIGEKRVVVFALFTAEMKMLAQELAAPGTEIMVIGGSTPSDERIRMRARFGSDAPERIVLIAQVRTMSLAVNELTTASHAVYGSLSQLRDDYVQSRDRLDRIGQTKPVTFWLAVVPGTVDDVILKSHRERTNLESAMLRHIAEEELPSTID